ncbi:polysaccharide deacetylase family protein [Azospirillum canadense]|uniref:polysaccharide deacetylase family protein n=1 Tax=Azospirillum canadense TaxID=403962 RepID=UPI002227D746|nr:polysaccharide deacetylase family protein [Azospirillum canadense]MCW2240906.1 hypothetical protein [Azospirillum canadense]
MSFQLVSAVGEASLLSSPFSRTTPLFPASTAVAPPDGPPILCVIIDAEEDFNWAKSFSRQNTSVASIGAQHRAHGIFEKYGVCPAYLLTCPVVDDTTASGILLELLQDGRCTIGAQLHPWVTPPYREPLNPSASFAGNLPPGIERQKVQTLVDRITKRFGSAPKVYKAGRYGIGPNTAGILADLGFLVDTSLMPRSNYRAQGGPDFSDFDYQPFWFGTGHRMLELPVTRALVGGLAAKCPTLFKFASRSALARLHLPAVLARSNLIERITLSPEGVSLEAMRRLTRGLLARGQRLFTLSYHSPSLQPGNTPYVSNNRELEAFLRTLDGFLAFFTEDLGGRCATPLEIFDLLKAGDGGPPTTHTASPIAPRGM